MNKWILHFTLMALALTATARVAADSATEIDAKADATLAAFKRDIGGGEAYLDAAKGALIFPGIVKGGFVFCGEYGEGALRIDGKTVDYYSTAGASFGFQFGVQEKSMVVLFMQQAALDKFRASPGFEVGVDGNVALVNKGTGGSVNTTNIKDPVVAFVFGNKGLMVDVSLDGSKFTKLDK